jgi:FG-GAP repeat
MGAAMTKLLGATGVLVLTLAAAGCGRATEAGPPVTSPRPAAPAPSSTSAQPTPSTVAAPAGAGWPAFTSVQGGYRLRHPPGWRVKESIGTGGPVLSLLPPRGAGITVLATWTPPPEAGAAGLPYTRCQPVRVGKLEGSRCLAHPDVLWYGKTDGAFSGYPATVNGSYEPLLGDFNGDGRGDVLWYAPGAGGDAVWYGRSTGGFSSLRVTVTRTYQPLVADFNDGDGRRDVLWYGPGADPDVLWFGHPDGRFRGRAVDVAGRYQPFTGDFDADGRRDVFWYGPGGGYDVVWYGRADGSFGAAAASVPGTYRPHVGDYGGDGPNDVFWYAPGSPDDVLSFGHANRRFTSRTTTLDIGHPRAPPLRPEALTSGYNPHGFVAHAFGVVDGHGYTNSLEAFQRNYGRGFRSSRSTWSASPTARRCWPTTAWRPTTA